MKQKPLKRATLLRALKALRDDAINNPNKLDNDVCICYHTAYVYGCYNDRTFSTLYTLFLGWDKHSGNKAFPIGDSNQNPNHWSNEWLALRIDLLNFTVKKLNKMKTEDFNELVDRIQVRLLRFNRFQD